MHAKNRIKKSHDMYWYIIMLWFYCDVMIDKQFFFDDKVLQAKCLHRRLPTEMDEAADVSTGVYFSDSNFNKRCLENQDVDWNKCAGNKRAQLSLRQLWSLVSIHILW